MLLALEELRAGGGGGEGVPPVCVPSRRAITRAGRAGVRLTVPAAVCVVGNVQGANATTIFFFSSTFQINIATVTANATAFEVTTTRTTEHLRT